MRNTFIFMLIVIGMFTVTAALYLLTGINTVLDEQVKDSQIKGAFCLIAVSCVTVIVTVFTLVPAPPSKYDGMTHQQIKNLRRGEKIINRALKSKS